MASTIKNQEDGGALDASGVPGPGPANAGIQSVNTLMRIGNAKQLAVSTSSNALALTAGTRRVTLRAKDAPIRYAFGTGAVSASATTSHYLGLGDTQDWLIDPTAHTYVAGIIPSGASQTSGALEISEGK